MKINDELGWLNVKSFTPNDGEKVIVHGIRGGIYICHYFEDENSFINDKGYVANVDFWLRLPPIPNYNEVK